MSSFSSTSDLGRSLHLKLAGMTLKGRLTTLSKEVASGIKSDIPQAVRGDLGQVNMLESRIAALQTYQLNAGQAATRFGAMQDSLELVQSTVSNMGPELLAEASSGSVGNLRVRVTEAARSLDTVIATINTTLEGKHLFSGVRPDTPPLISRDELLAQVTSAIAGTTTADEIIARVEGWFAADQTQPGFVRDAYRGSPQGPSAIPIDDRQEVGSDVNAASSGIKDTIKNLVLITIAADPAQSLSADDLKRVATHAASGMIEANIGITDLRAGLGVSEQTIARAQVRNGAESTALNIARNDIISADPYETATALKETEANLENIYLLTARLSNMSLANFLK